NTSRAPAARPALRGLRAPRPRPALALVQAAHLRRRHDGRPRGPNRRGILPERERRGNGLGPRLGAWQARPRRLLRRNRPHRRRREERHSHGRQRAPLLRPHVLGIPAARRGQRVDRMEAPGDHGEAAARRSELTAAAVGDAALVARCRAGDDAAWRELVDRFSRYVYAIAIQGFRLSQQDAEDVFQEVFARVYERLDSLREDEAVRPWIAQLTRRLCIDRLRAAARE